MKNNRLRKPEEGFGTAYAFVLIIFTATIFTALAYLIISSRSHISLENNTDNGIENYEIVEQIIESMLEDSTPGSDSPIDPVWETVRSLNTEQISVSLTDISSRINPNFFRDEIIDETAIGNLLFSNGHTMSELEQYRYDNGMSTDLINGYPEFFSDDALTNFLTPYSYFNINIADESALSMMYETRTGNEFAAESFRNKIRQYRINKTIVCNNELENTAGSDLNDIYPVINAVPVMNIHYIPEELLKEILLYDFGNDELKYPQKSFNQIIQRRENGEINSDELETILSVKDEDHRIFDYLGTSTWFWKITIGTGTSRQEIIAAEIPDREYSYRPRDAAKINSSKRGIQIISNIVYNEKNEE